MAAAKRSPVVPIPRGPTSVLVVGAGIIGRAAAWRLADQGHLVTLVDPALAADQANGPSSAPNGSQAALGVLMARVFHRSSGRAWRLRQQSLTLWREWLAELERRGHRLPRRSGLLLLATSAEERARQEQLVAERTRMGIPMQLLAAEELKHLCPSVPGPAFGALLSPEDGQLDPGPVLNALLQEGRKAGVSCVAEAATRVERWGEGGPRPIGPRGEDGSRKPRWRLILTGGGGLEADWLVLALGLGTAKLMAGLGHELALEPVLGQALELELPAEPAWNWPGVVVWRGINLVPRPDLASGGRRLWLGATLEPGDRAGAAALEELGRLGGAAPAWLRHASMVRHWQGLRCHPVGQAAPVLAEPEPHLLIASGHYRNGVLLAPATVAWLCERIQASLNP